MLKIKILNLISWQRILALLSLCLLIGFSLASSSSAQTVTTGYNADGLIQRGMIVRIKKDDPTKIQTVSYDTSDQMHGVVVSSNDAPVTIANDGQELFVATTGQYDVLVNDQNGKIDSGDYISISALAGVGMKAGTKEQFVIGRALSGFDGASDATSKSELTDNLGNKRTVNIGRVQVDLVVARNPHLKGEDPNVPEFLRKAAQTIAGKPVDAVRIYLGILVFGITTFVAGSLLYGGVRSGLISIGRNPLSKKSIARSMIQVIVTGIIVFTTGVFGVYLILRL